LIVIGFIAVFTTTEKYNKNYTFLSIFLGYTQIEKMFLNVMKHILQSKFT